MSTEQSQPLTTPEKNMGSAEARNASLPTRRSQAPAWQVMIPPSSVRLSLEQKVASTSQAAVRIDAASPLGGPKLEYHWSASVGFHQPLATALEIIAPTVELGDSLRDQSLSPSQAELLSYERRERLEQRELAARKGGATGNNAQAAHQLLVPLEQAKQIVFAIAEQVKNQQQVTRNDLKLLKMAQLRIRQANQRAERFLHQQPGGSSVRHRFYPAQWLELIQSRLETQANQAGVRLVWVGWDRSLPRLYLDVAQLRHAMLRLVSSAIATSLPGDEVCVRVAWQRNVTQQLIIAVEDMRGALSDDRLGFLNLDRLPKLADRGAMRDADPLNAAKQLIHGLGGDLSARRLPTKGLLFRISLPTDDPLSLVRCWLARRAPNLAKLSPAIPYKIGIYAVRARGVGMDGVDRALQQTLPGNQLLYRVSKDRWLWVVLTQAPMDSGRTLHQVLQRIGCRKQNAYQAALVYASECFQSDELQAPITARSLVNRLAYSVATRMTRLAGNHVPPVSDLKHRSWTLDLSQPSVPQRQLRADGPESHHPHLQTEQTSSGRNATQDSAINRALTELAEQWHATQRNLAKQTSLLAGISKTTRGDRGLAASVDASHPMLAPHQPLGLPASLPVDR